MITSDTPAGVIARLDAALARRGQSVIVRRYTAPSGSPRPKTDLPAKANVRAVRTDEIEGDIKATHSAIVLSPTGLADLVPLKKGDKIVVDGAERNIDLVKPIQVADVLVRMNLLVSA